MDTKTNFQKVFDNISEMLIEDLDYADSAINRLLNAIITNIIINKLDHDKRIEFYAHVMIGKYDLAQNLVLAEIPDIKDLIYLSLKREMANSL